MTIGQHKELGSIIVLFHNKMKVDTGLRMKVCERVLRFIWMYNIIDNSVSDNLKKILDN
jgi:hypothetical protein